MQWKLPEIYEGDTYEDSQSWEYRVSSGHLLQSGQACSGVAGHLIEFLGKEFPWKSPKQPRLMLKQKVAL